MAKQRGIGYELLLVALAFIFVVMIFWFINPNAMPTLLHTRVCTYEPK